MVQSKTYNYYHDALKTYLILSKYYQIDNKIQQNPSKSQKYIKKQSKWYQNTVSTIKNNQKYEKNI